jgi:hypothetical protein
VLDKVTADAFVDAYAAFNFNTPKPQFNLPAPLNIGAPPGGGNMYRAFDVAQGFAVNWAGINASYAADPIGGTIGLRMGPGAIIYNSGNEEITGMNFVKQAYATWKPVDKLTLDFGKWDEPFGSEVADSQLNMNYTRSGLFWYYQPLFFTGLRVDYAASSMVDIKVFAANGWNVTLDNNAGKTFGAQIVLTPASQAIFYLGYAGGPEQNDVGIVTNPGPPPTMMAGDTGGSSRWRHLVDFVADINPTSSLRFLANFDYRTESNPSVLGVAQPDTSGYGANLVIKYAFSDAFSAALRGEYLHDDHGGIIFAGAGQDKTDFEDGTLTLMYGVGNHLAFMLDGRYDTASMNGAGNGIFLKNLNEPTNGQFTTTLGIIASTK